MDYEYYNKKFLPAYRALIQIDHHQRVRQELSNEQRLVLQLFKTIVPLINRRLEVPTTPKIIIEDVVENNNWNIMTQNNSLHTDKLKEKIEKKVEEKIEKKIEEKIEKKVEEKKNEKDLSDEEFEKIPVINDHNIVEKITKQLLEEYYLRKQNKWIIATDIEEMEEEEVEYDLEEEEYLSENETSSEYSTSSE